MTDAAGPARGRRLPFADVRRRLAPFSPDSGPTIALLAVLTVVGSLAEAGALLLVARTALAVTSGDEVVTVTSGLILGTGTAVVVALLALLVKLLLFVLTCWLNARLAARTVRYARHVVLTSFFRARWSAQSEERLGELQDYLTTAVGRLNNINVSFVNGLNALASFTVIIVTAVAVNPLAAVGCAVAAAMLLVLLRPLTRRTRSSTKEQQAATRALGGEVTEAVRLAQEVRVFGVGPSVLDTLAAAEARASVPLQRSTFTNHVGPGAYQTLALAFLVLAVGLVSLVDGAEVASLGAAVVLLLRGLAYGQSLQTSIQALAGTLPFLDALHERKASYDSQADRTGHRTLDRIGAIELHHVDYGYTADRPVIQDLHLTIGHFESIGVVGPSGSGKSTLIQLLLRLREPTGGSITVDDVDLWDVRAESWAARVAFVPQDARLLSATVSDNISFFRDLDQGTIERAARLAHIHDDVVSWPNGYETSVGESGNRISGGQPAGGDRTRPRRPHPTSSSSTSRPAPSTSCRSRSSARPSTASPAGSASSSSPTA